MPTLPLSLTLSAGFIGSDPLLRILSAGAPAFPTTISLAPGVLVPIPTLPVLVDKMLNPLSIQPEDPPEGDGVCHVAKPLASAVKTAPATAPLVTLRLDVVNVPLTSNLDEGVVVPTPTLPSSFTRRAGFIGLAPSCKMFSVGAPASPMTINRAPGAVVPIPTLPFSLIRSAGFIGLAPSLRIFIVGAPS